MSETSTEIWICPKCQCEFETEWKCDNHDNCIFCCLCAARAIEERMMMTKGKLVMENQQLKKTPIPAVTNGGTEMTAEEMANAIRNISSGMKSMLSAGLNRRAITVLLRESSGVGAGNVCKVLDALEDLARVYTTPRK